MTGGAAGDVQQAGTKTEPGYARNFLILLFVVNLLNYIDRNAVNGLLEPIRKDFGATDAQMGLVGLAFLATYALLPPVFGFLGDRFPRKTIISWSAAFWCFATAAAGLSRSVFQLSATRAAVGVGEASYMANAPSLIADLFKVFDQLRRQVSIVIVEHNLDLVLALADRVFVLERGAVFHQGPAAPLLSDLDYRKQILWL